MTMPKRSKIIDRHIAALKEIDGKQVEAGWFESDRYGQTGSSGVGLPVAYVARVQEFGATIKRGDKVITIPARSFMRLAWSKFSANRKTLQNSIAKKVLARKLTGTQALGQIGNELENCIASAMRDGGWQNNAPSVVQRKGFDKPLFDTGHMFKTINSKVS